MLCVDKNSVLSHFSHVQLFATLWTVACQAPLSMGLSRQEYWSGLPFPSPGSLPNPGIEPYLLQWQVDSLPLSLLLNSEPVYLDCLEDRKLF